MMKCVLCNKPTEQEYLCSQCADKWKEEIIKSKESHRITPDLNIIYNKIQAFSFKEMMKHFAHIDEISLGKKEG